MVQQSPNRKDVYAPDMAAVVNGVTLDVSQVQVDRALPDPLAGGSLTAASASFTAVQGDDVVTTVSTPWDPSSQWPPVPESPASVSMDSGAGPVSLMANGRVVSASGGTSGREIDVEISDAYQTLDRPISWDAFSDAMPALTEATTQRYVSLRASAVTDMILRNCGWYATPPRVGFTALSVPAMGTMWPESGTCVSSTSTGGLGYPPMFTEPWGVGVGDVTAVYSRAAAYSIKGRGRAELTAVAGRLNGGTKHLLARTDGFRWVRLSWTDSTASVWYTNAAGAAVVAVSMPRAAGSFLYATVEYVSDTSARIVLRVDGVASSSILVSPHSDVMTQHLTTFEISGDGVGGGFQVGFPSTSGSLASWTPNAVIYDRAGSFNALQVLPSVAGENCADLLNAQCEAQNATYWIDETGVLRWWDLAQLEARSTVATLTSDDDIAEGGFTWDHSLSSVKRSVTVNWRQPLIEGGWRTDVDLWQGSGQTLSLTDSNNGSEDWIKAPDDEVWIMPDLSLSRVGDGSFDDFNYGWGSHYGAVTRTTAGAEEWAQISGSYIVTVERVTDSSFKYVKTWTGSRQATERTPANAESAGMWGIRRGFDLPIIRGKKKYTLGDMVYEAAQKGPATAPDHVIDAGWWIQNETQAQKTADYAAARVTVPQPVLSSVALIPFPGLQLGDMVEVRDDAVTRLTIRGTVVEDSRDIDADMGMTHSVAIRPLYITRNGVTWQEWATAARPKSWSQWSNNQASTWSTWGANPLLKETVI